MTQETNRLLMEVERSRRNINHEIINPNIRKLTLDGLDPVLRLVANARARYITLLFELGDNSLDRDPTPEEFADLRRLREEFDELVKAAQAMETAIQRGYLDVEATSSR